MKSPVIVTTPLSNKVLQWPFLSQITRLKPVSSTELQMQFVSGVLNVSPTAISNSVQGVSHPPLSKIPLHANTALVPVTKAEKATKEVGSENCILI